MDNLTHSLLGLTLARTPISRAGPGTTTALLLASNVPDIDIVAAFTGGASRYLSLHRGPTHGPLGAIGLSLLVAAIAWGWAKAWSSHRQSQPPRSIAHLWGVAALGVVLHVLMDLPTSYGTRALSPFSWTWYTLDWMPIIDVYLLAVLLGGLVLGRLASTHRNERRRHAFAAAALALAAMTYGLRAAAHRTALDVVTPPGPLGRAWCADAVRPGAAIDRWPLPAAVAPASPGDTAEDSGDTAGDPGDPCVLELVAIPDFLSPFRWRVVARSARDYGIAHLNLAPLLRGEPAAVSAVDRVPNHWNDTVTRAAATPSAQVFLGFSRLPAVRVASHAGGTTMVRWIDLRFFDDDSDDEGVPLRRSLFGATVVVDGAGTAVSDHLGP